MILKSIYEREWTKFLQEVDTKLEIGAKRYPDHLKPPPDGKPILEIIKEWKEETVDIAGWGYVFWKRLDNLEREIRDLNDKDVF